MSTMQKAAEAHPKDALPPFDELLEMQGGFEALRILTDCFGGTDLYVPTLRTILRDCLKTAAMEEFNGTNVNRLAMKYGYSARYLRKVLSE
jgi:Mor family transcriptional regulator